MRDYGVVSPKFWIGGTGKALRGNVDAQLVALYLMTSPHANMIGVFYCPLDTIAKETGLPIEGASEGLQSLIEADFCQFDADTEEVFACRMAAYQIGEQLETKDNRCKGVARELERVMSDRLKAAFRAIYSGAFHLPDPAQKASSEPAGTQAPSEPLRSQKQEQKQEQEQKGESAASQRTPRPRKSEVTLNTFLETCRAEGRKPLPADHPVREYCRDAGIAEEMLQVAWCVFREDYTTGTNKDKRYKDWPGTFANAVRGCWAKLWYSDGGEVKWTSRGLQEKQVLETRMKAKEGAHAA